MMIEPACDVDEHVFDASESERVKVSVICNTKLHFGNSKTNAVCELIKSYLATEALDQNLFDEKREVYAFNNIAFNLVHVSERQGSVHSR